MLPRDKFCSQCGHEFGEEDKDGIHFKCTKCSHYAGYNPKPINLVILPVRKADGKLTLLTGKRNKPKDGGYGKFALPGGWFDCGEEAPAGGARELFEEHSIEVDSYSLVLFDVITGDDLDKISFCWLASEISEDDLPEFIPSNEVSEQKLITRDHIGTLAFTSHDYLAEKFFNGERAVDPSKAGRTLRSILLGK